MTVPTNLFVEAPEMSDSSMTRLEGDSKLWPEEIIQKLRERAPSTANLSCMVKFMKKDDENGTATGSVVLTTPDTSIVVPVIIKDFVLYPMDVMIAKGKILPLVPDYLDAIISKNEVFAKIEEFPSYGGLGRFEDANLWNAMYPPSLGRYAYASAGYPMMDLISETVDGKSLSDHIKANPTHLAGFVKNGHYELIQKVANLRPVNMNEFRQSAENLIPKNIRMLRLEGPNKYNLLSSNDKVFSPAAEYLTRDDAQALVSKISDCVQDDMNEVDQNGEKFLMLPEGGDVVLATTDKEVVESANEFGHFVVKNKNGVSIEGVVVPTVIDFNQEKVALKIFLGKTMSTIQPDIYGVRLKNSRFQPEGVTPRVGQTGTFLYQKEKGHGLCTIPVTVRSVSQDSGSSGVRIKAVDLLGRPYELRVASFMGLQNIVKTNGVYDIPKEMKWIPMEGFDEVTNSIPSYLSKTASEKLAGKGVRLSHLGGDRYLLRGVEKYAQVAKMDHNYLAASEAKFLLGALGTGGEKIAEAFSVARKIGHVDIHGLNFLPFVSDKVAAARPKAEKLVKAASSLRTNLIKEAGHIDNAQTMDSLLSLNFITPENIMKFVGKIPHFKATISNLAGALIASRLGVKEIPEEATSCAMHRLVEVINGLESLRAKQEVGV